MPEDHEQTENAARNANSDAGQEIDDEGKNTFVLFIQPIVEAVPLKYSLHKPLIYRADDIAEAHGHALAEVAKFMRHDSREFSAVQSGHQRQPDREHDIVAEQTGESGPKTG